MVKFKTYEGYLLNIIKSEVCVEVVFLTRFSIGIDKCCNHSSIDIFHKFIKIISLFKMMSRS